MPPSLPVPDVVGTCTSATLRPATLSGPTISPSSERTLTDLKALLTRLEQVRKQGYAISDGENAYGLRTVAAPVLGPDKSVIAGISLTIDASRMDFKSFEKMAVPRVLGVAKLLTDASQMSG